MRAYRYLFSYACFTCRKAFKQPTRNGYLMVVGHNRIWHEVSAHQCPECGGKLYFMGRKFKPPRQSDKVGWQAAYEKFVQAKDWTSKGTLLLYQIEANAGLRRREK
jgi:DNA-directed RNA polymerase subunit RPC12/RpoP